MAEQNKGDALDIRLCNWRAERGPPWGGFAELGR